METNNDKPTVVKHDGALYVRLGDNGRKDFEWAMAWGIVKAFFILIPLIVLLAIFIPILIMGA